MLKRQVMSYAASNHICCCGRGRTTPALALLDGAEDKQIAAYAKEHGLALITRECLTKGPAECLPVMLQRQPDFGCSPNRAVPGRITVQDVFLKVCHFMAGDEGRKVWCGPG